MGKPTNSRTAVRAVARRALGDRYEEVARWTGEARHRAGWLRSPMRRITRAYVASYGLTVRRGPFSGLRYPPADVANVTTLVPKLMGSYERELHVPMERLLEPRPSIVVNAGCADGYYAVGLARRLPEATVHAFDLEPRWRWICGRLARVNGVSERVVIGERLDPAAVEGLSLAGGRAQPHRGDHRDPRHGRPRRHRPPARPLPRESRGRGGRGRAPLDLGVP